MKKADFDRSFNQNYTYEVRKMDKELLQGVYDRTELERGDKEHALEARKILALEKLNDTLNDIETTLARLTSEITDGEE